jgi:hypothetical protein
MWGFVMYSVSQFNMSGGLKRFVQGLGVVVGLLIAHSSYATVIQTVIQYDAIHLASSQPGQNLWQYSYHVSGFKGGAGWGFDIFFPVNQAFQFGDIKGQTTGNGGWDLGTIIQADPGIPSDGFVEARALGNSPSFSSTFDVTFDWRNFSAPGSQPFQVFDSNFVVQESGNTVSSVPEPESVWQVVWTIPLLVRFIRKKKRQAGLENAG